MTSSGEVPALHQHRAGAHVQHHRAGALHLRHVAHLEPGQQRRFIQVGRHQRGERQQPVADHLLGVDREQPVARGGDHDRVHHQRRPAERRGCCPPRVDASCTSASMPVLSASGGRSAASALELLAQEHRGGTACDRAHPEGVLRRERHDGRRAEDAELMKGLEVGLDAGAAAGVRAGDRERDFTHETP